MTPEQRRWVDRGHAQPHLLDWNRGGKTDLVLSNPLSWELLVGAGPLEGLPEIPVRAFSLPKLSDRNPYDFQFADWDGDGVFDVLFAGAYLNDDKTRWIYDLYWCRNLSSIGNPRFAPPVRLLNAPAQSEGWQYEGFAVMDRGKARDSDLVVSVSKNWKSSPTGSWTNDSRLVLFPRNAKLGAAPEAGRGQ